MRQYNESKYHFGTDPYIWTLIKYWLITVFYITVIFLVVTKWINRPLSDLEIISMINGNNNMIEK